MSSSEHPVRTLRAQLFAAVVVLTALFAQASAPNAAQAEDKRGVASDRLTVAAVVVSGCSVQTSSAAVSAELRCAGVAQPRTNVGYEAMPGSAQAQLVTSVEF